MVYAAENANGIRKTTHFAPIFPPFSRHFPAIFTVLLHYFGTIVAILGYQVAFVSPDFGSFWERLRWR
jgi:hypothetical protein